MTQAPPVGASALTLRGISRRFGAGEHAVDDLSLDVASGELIALVGASGSGKTTTLRMVAGYERPDAGSILLDGRDITTVPPERRGFGMVFQHYALFPHMSVEQNVAFGLEARGVSRAGRLARARAALVGVGLEGKGGRPVQALSGGEQQRVALARALVIEPRILLLDEPLSNLDPTLRQRTREELRAILHRLQLTALFVTHDQEDAFAIADRVAILRRGKLLQVGAPEELYAMPSTRAVAEFIGRGTLVPAEVSGGFTTITIGGHAMTVRAVGDGARPGAGSLAVLRPESLAISDEGWKGTIVSRRFAGATFVYLVRTSDGILLEVADVNGRAREGEHVAVRVSREPVAVVTA